MATRNAGWVPKNYILLAQFVTMTSLKGLLFFSRFLVDYTNITYTVLFFLAKVPVEFYSNASGKLLEN